MQWKLEISVDSYTWDGVTVNAHSRLNALVTLSFTLHAIISCFHSLSFLLETIVCCLPLQVAQLINYAKNLHEEEKHVVRTLRLQQDTIW